MAWQTPKTDWQDSDLPTSPDFDRIERNIKYLQDLLG